MMQRSLFEYLVNSLWQLPLLLAVTWLLVRLARPMLLAQHLLWLTALLLGVLLPLRGITWSEPAIAFAYTPLEPLATPTATLLEPRVQPLHLTDRTIDWLLELYAVSIAFSLARLLHGWLGARRLVATSEARPLTTLETALLRACAERLRLSESRIPELRFLADTTAGPMVAGIRHPVLLLPASLRHAPGFDDRALTAIFAHELAHIRRRDYLANLLARMVALPIAYHPATHVLHRRIRQTREMLCDAHAADAFGSPSCYARSLLALAAAAVPTQPKVAFVGLLDQTRNPIRNMEERIMKLTESTLPVSLAQRIGRIAAGSAILLAGAAAAATVHLKPSTPVALYAAQAPVPQPQQPPAQPAVPPVAASAPKPPHRPRHSTAIENGKVRALTPEEQKQIDADLSEQLKVLQSPAFKKQIADAANLANSPEFRKSMDDLKAQMNSPEFKKQIADAARSASEAALNSENIKRQMEDVKRQMEDLKRQMNSAEFRRQMEEARP